MVGVGCGRDSEGRGSKLTARAGKPEERPEKETALTWKGDGGIGNARTKALEEEALHRETTNGNGRMGSEASQQRKPRNGGVEDGRGESNRRCRRVDGLSSSLDERRFSLLAFSFSSLRLSNPSDRFVANKFPSLTSLPPSLPPIRLASFNPSFRCSRPIRPYVDERAKVE
ncbi:hypothetical protein ACLOJK_007998 [Asimina triloba]